MNRQDNTLIWILMAIGLTVSVVLWAVNGHAQTIGNGTLNPAWITNQGGGNKPCVGLMQPNVPYIVVNDNRGAYTIFNWDATASGHIDMQDNDPPTSVTITKNKFGRITAVTTSFSPLTNLTINVYAGDQTTGCDTKSGNLNGCTLFGTEHYTMNPGTTMPYPWSMIQILPNGLEFEGIVVTAQVDRPATCTGSHYITMEHSNPQ